MQQTDRQTDIYRQSTLQCITSRLQQTTGLSVLSLKLMRYADAKHYMHVGLHVCNVEFYARPHARCQ